MKISLDYDDLSPMNHRFDILETLRDRYPGFKVTMFTIPWDIRFSPQTKGTPITDERFKEWVDYVRKGVLDKWLEISLHGLTHAPREMEHLNYEEVKKRILTGQKMFANVGIPINNLFKAPQWLINEDGKKAVNDLGLTLMEDGYYNWNLKNKAPEGLAKPYIAHGHVQDVCNNGMEESLIRLMKVPIDSEWVFLKDVV